MTVIFTILKDMTDNANYIAQYNALMSWRQCVPGVSIIAFGDKPGAAELCQEIGIPRISGLRTDKYGLEYVSDTFRVIWKSFPDSLYCYCNADIILPPTFFNVALSVKASKFMLVGQRWNAPIKDKVYFTPGWWSTLKKFSEKTGAMHPPSGMDYFVHTPWIFHMPDLLVGRYYWDNVMVDLAKLNHVPVIDITKCAFVIHQNHPPIYTGADDQSNFNKSQLSSKKVYTISDADYVMEPSK